MGAGVVWTSGNRRAGCGRRFVQSSVESCLGRASEASIAPSKRSWLCEDASTTAGAVAGGDRDLSPADLELAAMRASEPLVASGDPLGEADDQDERSEYC